MMQGTIYVLTFADGKHYVGQTRRSLHKRMIEHRRNMRNGVQTAIYDAWRNFGEPFCQVAMCDISELDEFEIVVIETLDCMAPQGYNSVPGGGFLPTLDPAIAARIGDKHRTDPTLLAKIRRAQALRWKGTTPEERSEWMRAHGLHAGKKHSAESKEKMSASLRGKNTRPKSADHVAKVAAANRGKKRSPEQIARISQGTRLGMEARKLEARS